MKLVNIQDDTNNLVKKHNDLIKAKGDLSETAQKMLLMIIAMIRVDDTEFQRYALSIANYKKEIESKSKKSKRDFIEQAKELMRNPFELENGDIFNWCSKIATQEMDGYIIFDIHPELKPLLLELKKENGNFTKYQLVNVLQLGGIYSPRLYEYLLMRYGQRKYGTTVYQFDIKIDDFRELLKIKDSYRYDKIKARILDKAKNDFKKYTDIQFEYKEQKIGRKVDRLIITIKPNKVDKNNSITEDKEVVRNIDMSTVHTSIVCLQGIDNVATTDFYEEYTDGSCSIILKSGNKVFLRDKSEDITQSKYLWDMIQKG